MIQIQNSALALFVALVEPGSHLLCVVSMFRVDANTVFGSDAAEYFSLLRSVRHWCVFCSDLFLALHTLWLLRL